MPLFGPVMASPADFSESVSFCNHSCIFCAEPIVVGHRVQYREIAAIMGDIELLAPAGTLTLSAQSIELSATE